MISSQAFWCCKHVNIALMEGCWHSGRDCIRQEAVKRPRTRRTKTWALKELKKGNTRWPWKHPWPRLKSQVSYISSGLNVVMNITEKLGHQGRASRERGSWQPILPSLSQGESHRENHQFENVKIYEAKERPTSFVFFLFLSLSHFSLETKVTLLYKTWDGHLEWRFISTQTVMPDLEFITSIQEGKRKETEGKSKLICKGKYTCN